MCFVCGRQHRASPPACGCWLALPRPPSGQLVGATPPARGLFPRRRQKSQDPPLHQALEVFGYRPRCQAARVTTQLSGVTKLQCPMRNDGSSGATGRLRRRPPWDEPADWLWWCPAAHPAARGKGYHPALRSRKLLAPNLWVGVIGKGGMKLENNRCDSLVSAVRGGG
jgi:hypothetical protein